MIAVTAWTLSSALGHGRHALAQAVSANRSALAPHDEPRWPACHTGPVNLATLAPPELEVEWDCRATRLAAHALNADGFRQAVDSARRTFGADRVGLVLGTSASTIGATEAAYRDAGQGHPVAGHPGLNNPHGLALFVQGLLGLQGPAQTLSTACSSSAKAFGVASRWLRHGQADAVVVAGIEALCDSLVHGFASLQLLSAQACRPFDAQRCGISIGEAAGYALLQRGTGPVLLRGCGEASDAHHMSAPHPQGLGAERAVHQALHQAGIPAGDVDYLNLHGTATVLNDAVEAAVVDRLYGVQLHASATKGLTGHAMGAAGMVEAAMCFLALEDGLLSGSPGLHTTDPALPEGFYRRLATEPARRTIRWAASHSFGFGGRNTVLVFSGPEAHA